VGVMARPACGIICQRARSGQTTTELRPDPGDEQRQSAAQRLGCDRTIPASPCAVRAQLEMRKGTVRGIRRRPRAGCSADAVSVQVMRLKGASRLATVSAGGHSKEGR
jgi:hypothetical protein